MIKKILYMAAILALGVTGLTSCNEDYAQPPVILPEGGIGTGAWDNPMTAHQVNIGTVNPDLEEVWVTGYIVGCVNRTYARSLHAGSAQFEAPFATINNILMAMTPDERDWKKCITVQLTSSTDARNDLNVVNHPENAGKLVTIKGTVSSSKYLGAYGVRDVAIYKWGDQGIYEPEPVPYDGPFFEDFDSSTSFKSYYQRLGWRNVTILGGLSGWYVTSFQGNNYITVSSYQGTATGGPYENWLVSPGIELEKLDQKTIEFLTQAQYTAENSFLEVYAMTTNNPKTSTNTKLDATIAVPGASGASAWVSSGLIDLSEYNGTIYIGWRYYSEQGGQSGSTTYRVDNVSVGGATAADKPATPEQPSNALYSMLKEKEESIDWTFDNVEMPSMLSYIWDWKSYNGSYYLNASAYSSNTNYASEAYAYSPAISLAGVSGAYVEFEHAAKFQTTITQLGKFVIREAGSLTWTELDIPNWPGAGSWNFAQSGQIDISAFDGKEVELGFKYASTSAGADTWEIKNLNVFGNK